MMSDRTFGQQRVSEKYLQNKAAQIRMDVLKMVYKGKAGHTGSSLSCADIMTSLYYAVMSYDSKNPAWPARDRFVLSKGHAVESYYCILADLGFFPSSELDTFCQFGTRLIGHPNNKVPGVEMNTGALGHGLAVSVGMALAAKRGGHPWRVFILMGDGEQAEGSVWESAMAAAHYGLDNLVAVIDRNKLQISGCTEDVMALESLEDKWRSFGWNVVPVSGHDFSQLVPAMTGAPQVPGRPTLIMAYTTKGKDISFMENVAHWHHGVPDDDQLRNGLAELQGKISADSDSCADGGEGDE